MCVSQEVEPASSYRPARQPMGRVYTAQFPETHEFLGACFGQASRHWLGVTWREEMTSAESPDTVQG